MWIIHRKRYIYTSILFIMNFSPWETNANNEIAQFTVVNRKQKIRRWLLCVRVQRSSRDNHCVKSVYLKMKWNENPNETNNEWQIIELLCHIYTFILCIHVYEMIEMSVEMKRIRIYNRKICQNTFYRWNEVVVVVDAVYL